MITWRGKRLSQVELNDLSDEKRQEMVDLRIGLNIPGHDGARILYEYLRVSHHREEWRRTGQDPFELGKIAGGAYARRASEGETDRELRLRVEEAFSFSEKALGWKETD